MRKTSYSNECKQYIKKNSQSFQKQCNKTAPQTQIYNSCITQDMKHDELITEKYGHTVKFSSKWNIWIHLNTSNDWTLASYHKIALIETISDFWNFMNSFNKINYMNYQFFMMRENITPIWEDEANKNGGAASIIIKISDPNLLKIWEDICVLTINEQIYNNKSEINGVSFNLKNDLTVIKIWNKNMNDDISKKLPDCFVKKYKLYSISYRKNRAIN